MFRKLSVAALLVLASGARTYPMAFIPLVFKKLIIIPQRIELKYHILLHYIHSNRFAVAQKKTTKVEFCAVPTPEGSRLSVTGTGVFQVGGAAFPPAGTTLPAVSSIVSGPTFFNPVGNYMSPLLPGACPAVSATRRLRFISNSNTKT